MPNYIVEDVERADTFIYQGKTFQSWLLKVTDGGDPQQVNFNTLAGRDGPSIGDRIEGELKEGRDRPTLKRAQANGASGGSYRPRDPEESKRIVHQHAQKVAIAFLQVRAYLKKVDDVEVQDVFNLAARIREDVERVK
jgi:hypothetical protein